MIHWLGIAIVFSMVILWPIADIVWSLFVLKRKIIGTLFRSISLWFVVAYLSFMTSELAISILHKEMDENEHFNGYIFYYIVLVTMLVGLPLLWIAYSCYLIRRKKRDRPS